MIVVIIVVCLQRFLQIFFLPTESRYTFFESLRPTPEMSFAIRALGCQSGIYPDSISQSQRIQRIQSILE